LEPQSKPSYIDVAVLPWTSNQEKYDCLWLPSTMAITQEKITELNVGCGDEVFITGLFTEHYGKKRNLPIIRLGNIASMPEETINTEGYGDIEAYLIEAHSIGGLSGSPVFVHLGMIRVIDGTFKTAKSPIFYWLGLIHGHFDYKGKLLGDGTTQDDLYNLSINMGVAIVVPVARILDVLYQKEFAEIREKEIAEYKIQKTATPDTTSSI
jgi:hypothetical protein